MTARRVVTLTCDRTGCREVYVGSASDFDIVREVARQSVGWSRVPAGEGDVLDFCRWHS